MAAPNYCPLPDLFQQLESHSAKDRLLGQVYARLWRSSSLRHKASALAIDTMKVIEQRHREYSVIALQDAHPSSFDDEPSLKCLAIYSGFTGEST